jgi:ribose transport system substrate-binding protein
LALITGDNHDPFFVSMNAGAQAEAKALGVSVNWQGPAQYQASLQIPIVSAVLTSKPDFVFICPTDAQALGAPIKQLTSAGIPVMTLDSDINDTSARLGNITSNNLLGGQQAADSLANLLGGKGEVAVLNEQPGVSTTDLRQKGFEQELAKFPGIKYLGVGRDNDDTTTATTTASALLSRNPGLTGFFATDTANGAGAATAAQQAGRAVKVVAFDAEPEEVTALKLGHISSLIVQKAYDFGQLAVEDAVGYLNGNHAAIPPSTLETYVIATAQNINSPEVQKYLYIQK